MCVCVCVFLERPSGNSKTVKNTSNAAAMELWLSALSPGWRLLAALLLHFSQSLNHPV